MKTIPPKKLRQPAAINEDVLSQSPSRLLTILWFLLTGTGMPKPNSSFYQPEPEFVRTNPVSYQQEPEFRQITGIPVLNPVQVVPY